MSERSEAGPGLLGPTGDVVAHVLAHVIVPASAPVVSRAGSLFDARYVAWARARLPSQAVTSVLEDAAILGALIARAPEGHRVQALLVAFEDASELGSALRDAIAPQATRVTPVTRAAIESLGADALELLEITWTAIGLAWPSYREAWHRCAAPALAASVEEVAGALQRLAAPMPCVARERVRLAHPLGPRARCFPDVVVVGGPADWNGLDAEDVAVRVGHEAAVRSAGDLVDAATPVADVATRWALVEDLALRSVAARLAGHPLGTAHARFVAGLDLGALGRADEHLLAQQVARLG